MWYSMPFTRPSKLPTYYSTQNHYNNVLTLEWIRMERIPRPLNALNSFSPDLTRALSVHMRSGVAAVEQPSHLHL
jgi:hypothetical protein